MADNPNAHEELLTTESPASTDTGRSRKRKKKKYTDKHVPKTYYIEKNIFAAIEEILGNTWGEASKLINMALSSYIVNEYPKIAEKHGVTEETEGGNDISADH